MRGGEELIEHAQRRLRVESGGTTPDGRATLEEAECLGGCDFAPCMLAGGKLHKNLDTEQLDKIIDTWE